MKKLNSDNGLEALGVDPSNKENAIKFVQQLAKRINAVREVTSMQDDEYKMLEEAKAYLSESLKCPVTVELESKSTSKRAGNAAPLRPSIDISS